MNILIIGATRGIGAQLLAQGLEYGHQVTVLARDPAKLSMYKERIQVQQGDILDPTAVKLAMHGQEAVCLTIGVPITFKPVEAFSKGTANVIRAMNELQVKRLICITGIGAGDSKGHGGFLYDRIFKPLLLKTIYEDKDRQEELIQASGLDWVIFRPAGLTNGPRTGAYRTITDMAGVTSARISRADVADAILNELAEPRYSGCCPLLTY